MIGRMQGLHLTADLRGCDRALPVMADPEALRALCLQAVAAAGLQPVGELFHRFPPPGGVTGVDGGQETFKRIRDPQSLVAATVAIPFETMGVRAVELVGALDAAKSSR